jgi:hypothetical protein
MKTSIGIIFTSPKSASTTSMSYKFSTKTNVVPSILSDNTSPCHDSEEEGEILAPDDDINEDYIPCTPPTTPPKDVVDSTVNSTCNTKTNKLEELKIKTLEAKNHWIEKKNQWEANIEVKKKLTASNWLEFETKLQAKKQNWQAKVKETHTNLKIKSKQMDDLLSKVQLETIFFKPIEQQQEQQKTQDQDQDQEPYVQETTLKKFLTSATSTTKEEDEDDTNQTESEEEAEEEEQQQVVVEE